MTGLAYKIGALSEILKKNNNNSNNDDNDKKKKDKNKKDNKTIETSSSLATLFSEAAKEKFAGNIMIHLLIHLLILLSQSLLLATIKPDDVLGQIKKDRKNERDLAKQAEEESNKKVKQQLQLQLQLLLIL